MHILRETYNTPDRRKLVEPLFVKHVNPEFTSQSVLLRARVCTMWKEFCSFPFSEKTTQMGVTGVITVSIIVRAWPIRIRLILYSPLQCMSDSSLVVQIAAAGAIELLLLGKNLAAAEAIRPAIIDLLTRLFAILEDVGADTVVHTIEAMIKVG
jgi:hypothetical protein